MSPLDRESAVESNYADRSMGASARLHAAGWTRTDGVAVIAVTAIAAVIRLLRLSRPADLVFDETYYAREACYYARGIRPCGLEGLPSEVHPPLGKWLMSLGIRAFGYDSFGYRVVVALAGIATVALLYILARRILRSTLGATLAAALLAFDPLHFVQSRTAMLDILVLLFGTAAVLCAVYDRDVIIRRGRGGLARGWRAGAGAMAGAAAATKWSGAFFLLLVLVLTTAWDVAARRERLGRGRALVDTIRQEGPANLLYLVVLPVLVYVASYLGRMEGALLALPWSPGSWLHAVWQKQVDMASFHFGLEATHPYQSPAWSWILVKRPMSYFYETTASGESLAIMAVGNIIVWWSSLPALLFVSFRWVRQRDWRGPEGLILAGFALTYGPWLLQTTGRAALFIFYLLPTLPFMMLALGYVAISIGDTWQARATIGLFTALAIGYFAYFYPVLAETPLSYAEFRHRVLFERCRAFSEHPPAEQKELPPEKGWCWL
jgi:dolichyl-phosphate-mannose-protein mannosyltransferase